MCCRGVSCNRTYSGKRRGPQASKSCVFFFVECWVHCFLHFENAHHCKSSGLWGFGKRQITSQFTDPLPTEPASLWHVKSDLFLKRCRSSGQIATDESPSLGGLTARELRKGLFVQTGCRRCSAFEPRKEYWSVLLLHIGVLFASRTEYLI